MDFAISGEIIHPAYLVVIGFVIGALGGFFGVGGSFLAGPALYAVGVPMNFVVGTDMAHITGKSIVAARHHRALHQSRRRYAVRLGVCVSPARRRARQAGARPGVR